MEEFLLKFRTLFLLFLIVPTFSFCHDDRTEKFDYIGGFDVSKNDRFIVYSLVHEGMTSLRRYDRLENKDTVLVIESSTHYYIQPRFNENDNGIVFIRQKRDSVIKSEACIIDLKGRMLRQLKLPKGNVTDMIISKYSNTILFAMAQEYAAYSPIGVRSPHNFDIYSLDLSLGSLKQITELKAYFIDDLNELDNSMIAFSLIDKGRSGIFFTNTSNRKMKIILPKNDPRTREMVYMDGPVYSHPSFCAQNGSLAFTNIYELFIMSLKEQKAKSVYFSNWQIQDIKINNAGDKIIFTKNNKTIFYLVGVEDKKIEEIEVSHK